MKETTTEVYRFPNGFRNEATSMFGWLQFASLHPVWDSAEDETDRYTLIRLPNDEVPVLRRMQEHDPARWGNPPEN
jgi:hypothetical protein